MKVVKMPQPKQNVISINSKRRKKAPLLTDRHTLAFQVWNAYKPGHWVKSLVPSPLQVDLLNHFFEFCDAANLDPMQMIRDGLSYAKIDSWAMRTEVRLKLENFLRKEDPLCLKWANLWANCQDQLPQQKPEEKTEFVKPLPLPPRSC